MRLIYPDACKTVAIYLVTCAHCAQCLSGSDWTDFLGGKGLDIAIEMPLFMLMSGWFLSLDKMRQTPVLEYIVGRFRRLVVPAWVWVLVYCVCASRVPDWTLLTFYWYLIALFACLSVIYLTTKLLKKTWMCVVVSMLFVLFCPFSEQVNINFMIPFLWAGYALRRLYETPSAGYYALFFFLIGVGLAFWWQLDDTVYITPFVPLQLSWHSAWVCIYRFLIGTSLSAAIIYGIKFLEPTWFVRLLARLGKDTLVTYTFSFVFLVVVKRGLYHFNWYIGSEPLLDISSCLLSVLIVMLAAVVCAVCRKNKLTKSLFLGE